MASAKVVLCVCTCRRPAGLARLLGAVAELDFDGSLSLVVVDNDAAREGLAVCRGLAASYRWPLRCEAEARRGISYARNRAVALALAESPDFLAMLDDDEWPDRRWLRELLRVQTVTGVDVVGGPVLPRFPPDEVGWARLADLYGAGRPRGGGTLVLEATGNFLARATCFRDLLPSPFDEAFALSGGEDLVFFRRLAARGYRMDWAADALVYEEVPPSRMSLAWLRQRQFRRGNLNVNVQRMFAPGWSSEAIRLTKTVGLIILALGLCIVAWPRHSSRVRAWLLLHKALGKVAGHLGRRHLEYDDVRSHEPAAEIKSRPSAGLKAAEESSRR